MAYPRITERIRALTNPADHALLDACDAVDAIHASLEDENARLRSELESVGTAAYLYGRSDLKAENVKLRELVIELYEDQVEGYDEWKYIDSLRELGIEVDA